MKNVLIIISLFVISVTGFTQSYDGKSDQKINVGYEFYGQGSGIKATYDYGLSNLFSVGAGFSYFLDNGENDYFIFLRTSMHFGDLFDLPPQLDIYPGAELGYLSRSDIAINGFVGIRYFLTKKIGIYTEIGSTGSAGISLTF
jgi:hypothetical protein